MLVIFGIISIFNPMREDDGIHPDFFDDTDLRNELGPVEENPSEEELREDNPRKAKPGKPAFDWLRIIMLASIGLLLIMILLIGFQLLKKNDEIERLESTLDETLTTDTRTIENLREKLTASQERVKILESQNVNLRDMLLEAQGKVFPSQMDFNMRTQSRDSLVLLLSDQRNLNAQSQLDSIKREFSVLDGRFRRLLDENAELTRLLSKTEQRLDRATSDKKTDTWDIDPCKKRIESWQTMVQQRDDLISKKEMEIDSLKDYIEDGITGKAYR